MGRFRIAAGLTALAGCAAAGWLHAQTREPVFRVDVQLVRLLATVKDNYGRLIGDLKKEDFVVTDNGVPQTVTLFEHHTELPLSVALLFDTSGSTAKDFRYQTESTSRFLKALFREGNPEDAAALFSFNWQVVLQTGFTRNLAAVERKMRALKSEAGTSLYDAIYLASQELDDREGRKVVVVVTDGADTVSDRRFHDALEALHKADAVLYAILVMPITNDAGRNIGGENALTTISTGTGGRVFAPSAGQTLDDAFTDILREIRTQYLLGYYPHGLKPTNNRFHRIEVKAGRPGLRVITRTGYYEGAPSR